MKRVSIFIQEANIGFMAYLGHIIFIRVVTMGFHTSCICKAVMGFLVKFNNINCN